MPPTVALAVLASGLACLAVGWFGARYHYVGLASSSTASAASWASNGISESSSGSLFKVTKVRSYRGPVLYAAWTPAQRPIPKPVHGGRTCRNWAVTTSIFAPTTTVRQLAALPQWCVVVAGDRKGPKRHEYNVSNVVYLTPEDQEALPFASRRHLRWNHFGRKNLGFLYAVAHGARWVYDTDDDNELQRPTAANPIPLPRASVLLDEVASTRPLVNLYPQASDAPASWPRGFPLEAIKDNRTRDLPLRRNAWPFRRVGVLQSLADHDPDVDGIYRLTQPKLPFTFPHRRHRGGVLFAGAPPRGIPRRGIGAANKAAAKAQHLAELEDKMHAGRRLQGQATAAKRHNQRSVFQPTMRHPTNRMPFPAAAAAKLGQSAPLRAGSGAVAVTLREGSMMPYNAQATLHTYDALWSLLLPITVHGRVTDIWRAYFAQRLMWDVGLRLAFAWPWVTQYRNVHNLLGDFNSEVPLYQQSGALVAYLLEWKPQAASLPGRLEELYIRMYEASIVGEKDVALAQAWLADLISLGYRFPTITAGGNAARG